MGHGRGKSAGSKERPIPLPTGIILVWSGSIGEIPHGWVLCNGTNGTPDLRNRFIVGAQWSYPPGRRGGNVNHTHDFTSNGHIHSFLGGAGLIPFPPFLGPPITTGNLTGTTDNGNIIPPYYALAYIMKT